MISFVLLCFVCIFKKCKFIKIQISSNFSRFGYHFFEYQFMMQLLLSKMSSILLNRLLRNKRIKRK